MGKRGTKEEKMKAQDTSESQKEGTDEYPVDFEKMDKDYLIVRMREKEKEAAANYEKYLRSVAELENYKKRASKERLEAIKYGQEKLLKDILLLVDNLERASSQECNADNIAAFTNGIKLIQEQLLSCLERHGVERIDCLGKDFDPTVHEAMLQVDSDQHEQNKVVDEFEKGYLLNGRLLRAARVSVNKRTKQ